jgi:hypothetical protein
MATNSNDTIKTIFLSPVDIDVSRLVLENAVVESFQIGGNTINNTNSKGYYLDDNGEKRILFFSGPKQTTFGPSYKHVFGTPKEKEGPENVEGMQISYPLTSMKTVEEPTAEEAAFKNLLDAIWKLSIEKMGEEVLRPRPQKGSKGVPGQTLVVPPPTVNSYKGAINQDDESLSDFTQAIKVLYSYPKKKDEKTQKTIDEFDTTKPQRAYFPLITKGKGLKMKVHTKFYGPGDKTEHPSKYIGAKIALVPAFVWEGSYWGSCGPTSPCGGTIRIKLAEANVIPAVESGVPMHRMLARNEAPAEDDLDLSSGPKEDDVRAMGEGFAPPNSSDKNSQSDLLEAKVPPKPKPQPKAVKKAPVAASPKSSVGTKLPVKGMLKKAPQKKIVPKPEEEEVVDE